jgi:mannose-1-phosphate guanylyltransferase
MNADDHRWAVILPTSDGRRPYCTLNGGDALIDNAIRRARTQVAQQRICIVVEGEHERYWWPLRSVVPAANLLVQPRNCGTAIGILFAVLTILDRDPFAQLLFVPADHYFENEAAVSFAMERALGLISSSRLEFALIAVQAEYPAVDLAYIVPGARLQQDVYRVREFLERPDARLAQLLREQGSLWSTFLFCAWGFCILALLREYLPATVAVMSAALARADTPCQRLNALVELYEHLPTIDFSRAVMQKSRSMMQLIHAHNCGWSDLGSPQRIRHAIRNRQAYCIAAPSAVAAAQAPGAIQIPSLSPVDGGYWSANSYRHGGHS